MSHPLPAPRYEPRDAPPRRILLVGLGVAAGIAVVAGIAAVVVRPTPADDRRQTTFRDGASAETSVAADWHRQDALVHEHLETYGWIDRAHGVVRIPIERAMDLVAREGAETPGPPSRQP